MFRQSDRIAAQRKRGHLLTPRCGWRRRFGHPHLYIARHRRLGQHKLAAGDAIGHRQGNRRRGRGIRGIEARQKTGRCGVTRLPWPQRRVESRASQRHLHTNQRGGDRFDQNIGLPGR